MAFYQVSQEMSSQLEDMLNRFAKDGRPNLHKTIAITWIRYSTLNPEPGSGVGAGWAEQKLMYPASIVKLFYAVAIETWLKKDLIADSEELRRAMRAMISNSSNDATGYIVDLLTGTTSGPSLAGERWKIWTDQRNLINEWLTRLNWPELDGVNCCQKTWNDGPYGRDNDFYGSGNKNRNSLNTASTARMIEAVMTNQLVSPQSCKKLRAILSRSLEPLKRKEDLENQIDGFLGEGLPKGSKIWSKAGLMSQSRNDSMWCSINGSEPVLLVVFMEGKQNANDALLLPAIANELINNVIA